ncbi:YceD family protein [Schaalia sp. lx-100]|uniref:YceD family protein n=1 Tax=Schaalia sp. lx-100 TaxID=2899081 RepID=UPI001E5C9BAC|nr:YceD family protein [Schaalia sp. lx-100]MCD4556884.1 YceD family protein [Schaalia sp. lx-100]
MTEQSLEISLVDLPRHIGARKETILQWNVPDDLGTPVMSVPTGTVLTIEAEITSVDNGVLLRAYTDVILHGECVRCLDPVEREHRVEIAEMFFEHLPPDASDKETDENYVYLIGSHDTLGIEPLLRDAIVTLVEDRPLCSPDCLGLCSDCGEKWENLPPDHEHAVIDSRFAALAELLHGNESADA